MSEAIADRDEEMLARLAEFDLAAAERVHGRLMAAEEASELAELGRTYQRLARSLRQTLALKAKLKREREAAAKDALKDAPKAAPAPPGGVAVARRLRELRQAVTRVVWNEAEREDAAFYEESLDDVLAEEMLRDSFCAEPLDDHVARICLALDLSPEGAERWRDLPDPPEEPRRESSA
ncbi:MAG: hypothetical protein JWR47_3128 [Phenylobacterium sp.]|jgi:hypothetical protein|nr:hypothetical protein [Phenylobacterium sp.]